MSPNEARAKLAAELEQHDADTQTLGYERRLMLADRDAVEAIVRPMSIAESEGKREGGDGADRTALQTSGTVAKLILSPTENGTESVPAPTRALATECAECGTPLMPHEAAREPAGKFTDLCNHCARMALGFG